MISNKTRFLEWGLVFWMGVGLMSIINVWKITQNANALSYSWIMFYISLVFIIVCVLYLGIVNRRKPRKE